MTGLADDLRLAVRTLARRPGFSAVIVATLGLAIGANAAVFSLVDAILLRPLPVAAPERWCSTAPASRWWASRRPASPAPTPAFWRRSGSPCP